MRSKAVKIIFFSILISFFGFSQVTEALNIANNNFQSEINDLIAKEGGGKKSGGKKSGGKKSGGKKSGGNKSGGKKSGGENTQTSVNKVQSNYERMKDAAKERYKKWKDKKSEKSNVNLDSNK